jgi:hypothetical protein
VPNEELRHRRRQMAKAERKRRGDAKAAAKRSMHRGRGLIGLIEIAVDLGDREAGEWSLRLLYRDAAGQAENAQ